VRLDGESWPGRLITGGDLSPDGMRLVLRTYTAAYEWRLSAPARTAAAAAKPAAAARTARLLSPRLKQVGNKQPAPVAAVMDEARRAMWRKVWSVMPRSQTLPPMRQGEAICYSADGRRWFVSSEQLPTPIYEVELEDAAQPR
jgi:hypothetical protein